MTIRTRTREEGEDAGKTKEAEEGLELPGRKPFPRPLELSFPVLIINLQESPRDSFLEPFTPVNGNIRIYSNIKRSQEKILIAPFSPECSSALEGTFPGKMDLLGASTAGRSVSLFLPVPGD